MEIRVADKRDMDEIYALRFEVFVDEQGVSPDIEIDNYEDTATHIIATKNGKTIGCGRIIKSDSYAKIGRIAIKKDYRGKGLGYEMCQFIIEYLKKSGFSLIVVNAQIQAMGFYKKLGFIPVGEAFEEAGINHIRMEL